MSENAEKCLSLAEEMISSLPDKEIVNRYFAIKSKIIGKKAQSGIQNRSQFSLSSFQDSARKTQTLQSQLYNEITKRPTFVDDSDNESIALQLHELQKKIIPGQTFPVSGDAVEELKALKKIIDAKLNSLVLVRNKIREENLRLTNDYKELSMQLNRKVGEIKMKENEEMQKIAKEESELNDKYSLVEGELEDLREEYDGVASEHNELTESLKNAAKAQRQSENQLQTVSNVIRSKEEEREKLKANIEALKKELTKLTRSVAQKKYGNGSPDVLDEVVSLNEQVDFLKAQNAQMELQLKRFPSIVPDTVMATELDEDEIAKQILLSGYK